MKPTCYDSLSNHVDAILPGWMKHLARAFISLVLRRLARLCLHLKVDGRDLLCHALNLGREAASPRSIANEEWRITADIIYAGEFMESAGELTIVSIRNNCNWHSWDFTGDWMLRRRRSLILGRASAGLRYRQASSVLRWKNCKEKGLAALKCGAKARRRQSL